MKMNQTQSLIRTDGLHSFPAVGLVDVSRFTYQSTPSAVVDSPEDFLFYRSWRNGNGHRWPQRMRGHQDHNIGVNDATFKVLTAETGGNLFVMEHNNHKKGGPARRLHYNEEEYFYLIDRRYIVEVGMERFELGRRFPACAAQSSACIRKDSERTGRHVIILGAPISLRMFPGG